MTYKTIQGILMLPMAALIFLFPAPQVFAQHVSLNKVYDFSGNADTLNSQINFVYADSKRIIALGEAYPEHESPHAFVAAFDYAGNLLWQKPIVLPNGLITAANGYHTLAKVKSNLYVIGGNIVNMPKVSSRKESNPFLYLFNGQGDSIKSIIFPNDSMMAVNLTAITIDSSGLIIAGGDSWFMPSANSDTDVVSYPGDSVSKRNIWHSAYNDSLNFIKKHNIRVTSIFSHLPYFSRANPKVVNIIPVSWDSIRFRTVLNSVFPINSAYLVDIDSQFMMKNESAQVGQPLQSSFSNNIILAHGMSFESNFLLRKGTNNSFYWSLPAVLVYPVNFGMGIYYAKALSAPNIYPEQYQLQWEKAFIFDTTNLPAYTGFPGAVQGRSSLAEAINGDMLLQKEAGRPSDSLNPLVSHSGYFLPAMLRVDSNGNTRWGRTFQYVHSVDSGLYHSFNDLSVAPDGRIVMAGYLRSRYTVPGYDTVGTVSWLLVLSDSLHDHQQPPESIHLSGLGQKVEATVYPNPTLNQATVAFRNFKGRVQDITLNVQDFSGKRIQIRKCTNLKESISLNSYAPGIYFITILYLGKPAGTLRFVKY